MKNARVLRVALLSVIALGFATPAFAQTPDTATGTFMLVDLANRTITLNRTADGNQFLSVRRETPLYSGGLSGVAVDDYALIIHPDGSINGHGIEPCSPCTIGGRTGSYTATFSLTGTTAHASGRLTFQTASGELAGLHGGGTFEGGASGSYEYKFNFTQ